MYAIAVKEIWDLATNGQVLPFTLLLIPVALYWLLALLGTLDLDFLDVDLDPDVDVSASASVDAGGQGNGHGDVPGQGVVMNVFHGALRAINATDVPVMVVFSILMIMMWLCAMLGNLWFNAGGGDGLGTIIGLSAVAGGLLLTRVLTEPLKPVFRAMRGAGTPNRPVVGRSGKVRSHELDEQSGQVEIEEKGEVILINARLADGSEPLSQGAEVIVYDYNDERGIYYVRHLTPS